MISWRAAAGWCALATIVLALPARAGAQADDPIGRARALYAQAAYEDAVAAIDAIDPAGLTTWRAHRDLAEIRVLCLIALGRAADARIVMGQLIELDPLFTFPDGSPSVRSAYLGVRGAQLPSVVRARFAAAREAFAQGDYLQARAGFTVVRDLAADPALRDSNLAPLLGDLAMIADTYLDLAARVSGESSRATRDAAADVQPPVPVDEQLPPWLPGHIRPSPAYEARLEIVIGASGHVDSVRVVESNERKYDMYVLNAVRSWRYTPAFHDGIPVTFTKTVSVSIAPQ